MPAVPWGGGHLDVERDGKKQEGEKKPSTKKTTRNGVADAGFGGTTKTITLEHPVARADSNEDVDRSSLVLFIEIDLIVLLLLLRAEHG